MIEERRIQFVEASAQAFVDALMSMPVPMPAVLVGDGPLSAEIAVLTASAEVVLDMQPSLSASVLAGNPGVLVLTELDGHLLGDQLLACLDLSGIQIIAPMTARHFSQMPLFIVSVPKAGTHLIYDLAQALGYVPGVEMPEFPKPQTWYCVEYSNSHTVARDFFVDTVRRSPFGNRHHPITNTPVLFAYRHPLDVLVSEAHYYHRDGKTVFSGYFDGDDLDRRLRRLINDEWLLGSLRERVGKFIPWLRFPNVIPASFEELVGEAGGGSAVVQRRLIWSIMLKLQIDGCVEEISEKIFNRNSATFREGKIGAWRAFLPPELVDEISCQCRDVLDALGYGTEAGGSIFPAQAARYAARSLRYSSEDFAQMPLLVEHDFMGCNLVRYARLFYAVPLSAGAVALNQLSEVQLEQLPAAASLSELKAVLLIGREAHDRQSARLSSTGKTLAVCGTTFDCNTNKNAPEIIEEYRGFNLVYWRGRYYALRQSLGFVDLLRDTQDLGSKFAVGEIFVAHELDELKNDIDGTSTSVRVATTVLQAREIIASLQTRMSELELRLDNLCREKDTVRSECIRHFEELDRDVFGLVLRFDDLKCETDTAFDHLCQNLNMECDSFAAQNTGLCRDLDELKRNPVVRLGNFLTRLLGNTK